MNMRRVLRGRGPLVLIYLLLVFASCWWEFFGHNWVAGTKGWWVNGDLYLLVSGSLKVAQHGGLTHVYSSGTGILSPPGFIYFMDLLNQISRALGLGAPQQLFIAVPFGPIQVYAFGGTFALVLPILSVLSALPLVVVDKLATRVEAPLGKRVVTLLLSAVALFWMSVMWGHPDDAVAVFFLLWGVSETLDKRYARSAWIIGAALAFQPLVGLAVPVLLAMAPWRKIPLLVARMAAVPAVALLPQFVGDFQATYREVVQQPLYGYRRTPLLAFASHIPSDVQGVNQMMSGSSVRIFSTLAALGLGAFVFWRKNRGSLTVTPELLIWLVGVSLSLRILTEVVVWPYYLAPMLVLAACAALTVQWWRVAGVVVCTGMAMWFSGKIMAPWPYWIGLLALLVATFTLVAPWPSRKLPLDVEQEAVGQPRMLVSASLDAEHG